MFQGAKVPGNESSSYQTQAGHGQTRPGRELKNAKTTNRCLPVAETGHIRLTRYCPWPWPWAQVFVDEHTVPV